VTGMMTGMIMARAICHLDHLQKSPCVEGTCSSPHARGAQKLRAPSASVPGTSGIVGTGTIARISRRCRNDGCKRLNHVPAGARRSD
jgi:hypothetical protein